EIFEHAAIAAMSVDDHEIARRQRARKLAPKLADMRDEMRQRKAERAGSPIVLARYADRYRRQLPEIEFLAPTRDDAAGKLLGDDHVGIERKVRTVLLDGAERKQENRRWLEALADLGECQLCDDACHLARHGNA